MYLTEKIYREKDMLIDIQKDKKTKDYILIKLNGNLEKNETKLTKMNIGKKLNIDLFNKYGHESDIKEIITIKNNNGIRCYMKRLEYLYDKKRDKLIEEIFYDVMFIHDRNFYYIVNEHSNNFYTELYIQEIIKKEKKHLINYGINYNSQKNYFVGYMCQSIDESYINLMSYQFYINSFMNKKKKLLIGEFDQILDNFKNIKEEFIFTGWKDIFNLEFKKTIIKNNATFLFSLKDIFKQSKGLRLMFVEHFNMPEYMKNKTSLFELFHTYNYPGLENFWLKYNEYDLENYELGSVFLNKDKEELKNNFGLTNELFTKISEKELKNNSILFSKKINNLLKEKILFIDTIEYKKPKYTSLYRLIDFYFLFLFKNKENLQDFIEKMPITICVQNKENDYYCNRFSMNVNLYEENLLYPKDKYINWSSFMKDIIAKRFLTYEHFEKSFTKLLLKEMNKYSYEDYLSINNHLHDVYKMIYEIETIPEEEKTLEYYQKKFTDFDEFELYINLTYNQLNIEKIGVIDLLINNKIKDYKTTINNINYMFKQPQTNFELKIVGDYMKHCVYSYLDDIMDTTTTIVVMYDEDKKPIVCLEITKDKKNKKYICLQSKCKKNIQSKTYKDINEKVKEFLKYNNIEIHTNDI